MISRVAEHCFWMTRYLERAENTARILEVNQTLLLDLEVPLEMQWKPLLIISGIHDYEGPFDDEEVQKFITWNKDNPCSIFSSLAWARENARIIREIISADMWERINFYYLWMQGEGAKNLFANNRHEFYNQIKRINQLFHGIAEGTMAHGEAWDFAQFGKYLERASQTARILDVKYHLVKNHPSIEGTPVEFTHWTAILKSCSAYEPYHKQRPGLEKRASAGVAEFLTLDPIFPRSILFCLLQCRMATHSISERPLHQPENETERLLAKLFDWLNGTNIDEMVTTGLHESLTRIVDGIHDIGAAAHRDYFTLGH